MVYIQTARERTDTTFRQGISSGYFLSVLCSTFGPLLSRRPFLTLTTSSQSRTGKSTRPNLISWVLRCSNLRANPKEPLSSFTHLGCRCRLLQIPEAKHWKERNMDVALAPLRAWDDFFPGSDRFARPDFRDISKWNNRVVSNLLYYQTNYLVVAAMMISVVGFLSPFNMILGGIVVVLVFTGFVWAAHNKDILRRMKKQYPTTFVMVVMLASYFLISMFGGVMVFVFGITFPLLLMFIHASLRLRNLKNKLENKMEGIGLKKTPMGIILDALEQQEESITKFADYISKARE